MGVEEEEWGEGKGHPAPFYDGPEAVCEAQHVFVLWRGLGSLFKTNKKKKITEQGWSGV